MVLVIEVIENGPGVSILFFVFATLIGDKRGRCFTYSRLRFNKPTFFVGIHEPSGKSINWVLSHILSDGVNVF